MRETRAIDAHAEREPAHQHGLPNEPRPRTAPHQRVHHPPADGQIRKRRHQPRNARLQRRVEHIHVQAHRQITGQPSQHQIEDVVIGGEADGRADDLGLPQQVQQRRSMNMPRRVPRNRLRLRLALDQQLLFRGAQLWIFAGVAINTSEQKEVGEAHEAGEDEAPPPPQPKHQQAENRHANCGGELRRRIVERGGKAALALREPVAHRFRVRRKRGRLADPQQQARCKKAVDAGRQARRDRRHAPQECRHAPDPPHAPAVQTDAHRNLQHRVAPVVGAGEVAEGDRRDAPLGVQRSEGDRDIDPVEKVDQHADAEQHCDAPAAMRSVRGSRWGELGHEAFRIVDARHRDGSMRRARPAGFICSNGGGLIQRLHHAPPQQQLRLVDEGPVRSHA